MVLGHLKHLEYRFEDQYLAITDILVTGTSFNEGCPAGEWTCLDGTCIPAMLRCDGASQCIDRSDEQNCPAKPPPGW